MEFNARIGGRSFRKRKVRPSHRHGHRDGDFPRMRDRQILLGSHFAKTHPQHPKPPTNSRLKSAPNSILKTFTDKKLRAHVVVESGAGMGVVTHGDISIIPIAVWTQPAADASVRTQVVSWKEVAEITNSSLKVRVIKWDTVKCSHTCHRRTRGAAGLGFYHSESAALCRRTDGLAFSERVCCERRHLGKENVPSCLALRDFTRQAVRSPQ